MSNMPLKKTPLHEIYLEQGCKTTAFAGWEMPIQFSGLINEHKAVRKNAGIFDISHMGVFRLNGSNAKDGLQKLVPTDLYRIGPGEACYTVLLNNNGGVIDDLIIYDTGKDDQQNQSLLIVINASRLETDINWISKHLEPLKVKISNAKKEDALIAIQGPDSIKILSHYSNQDLSQIPRFGHRQIELSGLKDNERHNAFIARTGYTGEDGFEILLSARAGKALWRTLTEEGVTPCGLGARDTLRLEAAMHLYGNDLDESTTPLEAGLGWTVHLEVPNQFIGREALELNVKQGIRKKLVGLITDGRAIARRGYAIMKDGQEVGTITSGTWSPTLNQGVALGYVQTDFATLGNRVSIDIRGKQHSATITKRPFYRKT